MSTRIAATTMNSRLGRVNTGTSSAAITAFFVCLITMLLSGAAYAKKVGSVTLEDSVTFNDATLVLNGAGMRKRLFFKLYVGSLYVDESVKGSSAQSMTLANEAMLIQLNILSDLLTRDKLIDALDTGFTKSTGGDITPIQAEITTMKEAMQEPVRPGDVYRIAYVPEVGTSIVRGDETLVTIPGLPFKQAVFGIWLSDNPAQASLKSAMLAAD